MKLGESEIFCTMDNEVAKGILLENGMVGRFGRLEGKLAKGMKGRMQVVTSWDHPTHFIAGQLFYGFPDDGDNGYFVICAPKKLLTKEKFEELMRILLAESKIDQVRMVRSDSRDN